MATSVKVQKKRKSVWKDLLLSKVSLWLAVVTVSLIGWSIIDAPIGPGEPVIGRVTGSQMTKGGQRDSVIELPGDVVIRQKSVQTPVGGEVNCLRYAKRYWPNASYECQ